MIAPSLKAGFQLPAVPAQTLGVAHPVSAAPQPKEQEPVVTSKGALVVGALLVAGARQRRSKALRSKPLRRAVVDPECGRIGFVSPEDLAKPYDLVIIGGGPTGVAAAMECAQLGRRAIVIDKPKMPPDEKRGLDVSFGGPTGLFSKALRDVGKTLPLDSLMSLGLDDEVVWAQIRKDCVRLAQANAEHQVALLQKFKVDYLQASAFIEGSTCVKATPEGGEATQITTEKILVATGSKPFRPPGIPFDDPAFFDSDTVNFLSYLPKKVTILGSGIIAVEYAKIFQSFGADVTILVRGTASSALEKVGLDPDVVASLLNVLTEAGVRIFEGISNVAYGAPEAEDMKAKLCLDCSQEFCSVLAGTEEMPESVECDLFLAATGRRAVVNGFGLQEAGVKVGDRGGPILVDNSYETNVAGIYAAGDVIGRPALASTGVYQAQGAVRAMFTKGLARRTITFPVGMWTTPECGYYGLTKAAAEKEGMIVEEGTANFDMCLRGRVFAPGGLLKLVFRKDNGAIVGVHIIGSDACELVHYGMSLVVQQTTIFEIMSQLFTAVTFHELFKEAAIDGNGKLDFGKEWQMILAELGAGEGVVDEASMKQKFDEMDSSGDGSLDADELRDLLVRLGVEVNHGTVSNLVRLADKDGNGTIEWEELRTIVQAANETKKAMELAEA